MKWKVKEEWAMLPPLVLVLVLAALAMLNHGCSTIPPGESSKEGSQSTSSPPSSHPSLSTTSYGFVWDEVVQERLPTSLLQADTSGLCKAKIDPRRFWGGLVRALAYGESYEWRKDRPLYGKVDPGCVYIESFVDKLTGVNARSVGLLQLSVGDSLNYGGMCRGLTNENLKDPERNLSCGIEIMATLTKKYGDGAKLQSSLGRYWSTIRPGGRAVERLKIELPECK